MKNETKNQTKWSMDLAHSEISFKVRHLMISNVKGTFKIFDASIYTNAKDFTTAEIDLWIDASSISTGDAKRDEHLKGADFFDVQNHKQITFTSSTIGKADAEGNHELWGELTMKGITKNVKLNAQFGGIMHDPWKNEKAGFTVSGKIKRSEWGLSWNTAVEAGGIMVGDEISILCEVELTNAGKKDLTMELASTADKKGNEQTN
ncbi:MAG: YceI family protein [Bacteroidia bacterium]